MKLVRKTLLILVVVFAAFYLVSRPVDAAAAVRGLFDALGKAFNSLVTFFKSI